MFTHLLALEEKNQRSEFFEILGEFCKYVNSTTLQGYDHMVRFYHLLECLEPLQNYEIEEILWTLQFYSFLKLLNKFLVWIILRGEENFFNMSQLYTSTCNFKLYFQFLSFNLRYCTKNSENMPSIYKSTAKKTCQLIFCLDWICKIKPLRSPHESHRIRYPIGGRVNIKCIQRKNRSF